MAECSAKGEKWCDPVFPAESSSICPPDKWEDKYDAYDWARATKIPSLTDDEGDLNLFVDEPTPHDIQ